MGDVFSDLRICHNLTGDSRANARRLVPSRQVRSVRLAGIVIGPEGPPTPARRTLLRA